MKNNIIFLVLLSVGSIWAETGVTVDCKMSPAGSFQAKTKDVKGVVNQKKDELVAEKIIVNLKTLSSGFGLRDDHMKNKYLEVSKYPEATLELGKGKDGKGEGKVKIKGIEKDIKGTYKIVDEKEVQAEFELSLKDFKITGINYKGLGVKDQVKVTVTVPLKK